MPLHLYIYVYTFTLFCRWIDISILLYSVLCIQICKGFRFNRRIFLTCTVGKDSWMEAAIEIIKPLTSLSHQVLL